jgi:hypothetical protein
MDRLSPWLRDYYSRSLEAVDVEFLAEIREKSLAVGHPLFGIDPCPTMGIYGDWLEDQGRQEEGEAWRLLGVKEQWPMGGQKSWLWLPEFHQRARWSLEDCVFECLRVNRNRKRVGLKPLHEARYQTLMHACVDFVTAWAMVPSEAV